MRQPFKWLVLVLIAWPLMAHASAVISYAEKLLESNQPVQAYQWLNRHEQQLRGSAKGLYMYGVLALRLGHKHQAFNALQQVVSLAPNNIGAQLDLALAAIQIGNLKQADQLLKGLEQRNDMPDGVALLVASYRRKINHQLQPQANATTNVKLAAGYTGNVNLGLLTEQITLDTVSGSINLNVDPSNRAMGAVYKHVSVAHQRTVQDLTVSALGQITQYSDLQQYNTGAVGITVAKALTLLARPAQVGVSNQWQRNGDQISHNWVVKATTLLPASKKLSVQWDQQHKLTMQLASSASWLGVRGQWFAGLEQQDMRASHLGINIPWTVSNDIQLQLGLDYTVSQDFNPYSPSVFGDKPKMTQTLALKSNLSLPMKKNHRAFINIVWQHQDSNIALFRTRKASVEIGITKQIQ
jgi:hypothetical protein